MKMCAVCCTYKRPDELKNAVACFLWQDHPDKSMVILDDAGDYLRYHGREIAPRVFMHSTSRRFMTLGEKRNACAALAPRGTEAYCVWDDDDAYLPDHITRSVESLSVSGVQWSRPSHVYVQLTGSPTRFFHKPTKGLYHGGWSYTRSLFARVRGYPFMQSGQDQALGALFADQTHDHHGVGRPTYMYRYGVIPGGYNISAMAKPSGYDALAKRPSGRPWSGEVSFKVSDDWVKLREEARS